MPFGRPLPVLIQCVPSVTPSVSSFQTTSWSLVVAAGVEPTADSRRALATLCQIYWHPVYAFIRRKGFERDQAQDLTQSFFLVLLEKNSLRAANQERGRFRSFLLTSVKHFLSNQRDRARAAKRGGGQVALSLDPVEAESWYLPRGAVDNVTPERLFEHRWALSLLEQVMAKLRAEFAHRGKAEHFDRLSPFLQGDSNEVRYETLAAEMGIAAGALRTSVHRMRRKYRALVRAEIALTVSGPEEIDDEIRFLLTTLSG
jgi:DNA-directed RNA polymerase specialized sigma24 family protein